MAKCTNLRSWVLIKGLTFGDNGRHFAFKTWCNAGRLCKLPRWPWS